MMIVQTYLHCLMDIDENSLSTTDESFFCFHLIFVAAGWNHGLTTYATIGVVYGSVALPGPAGQQLLEKALDHLLGCFADANETEVPSVLWSLRFTQLGIFGATDGISKLHTSTKSEQILCFGPPSLDLAFDDGVVESVKDCWQAIVGEEARDGTFMTFADRETYEDD